MKTKTIKSILLTLIIPTLTFTGLYFIQPVSAVSNTESISTSPNSVAIKEYVQPESPKENPTVNTTFFDNVEDDGEGCGVYTIINLIVDIFSYGIIIAGAVGLVISGVSYMSAKGNEAKASKAKRRIFEIIIGLVIYIILWTIADFLLPGGTFNSNACKTSDTSSSTFGQKPTWTPSKTTSPSADNNNAPSSKNERIKYYKNKINDMAISLAWKPSQSSSANKGPTSKFKTAWKKNVKKYDTGDSCHRNNGKSCGSFASTVLAAAGVDKNKIKKKNYANTIQAYMSKSKKWQEIKKLTAGTVGLKYNGNGQWHVKVFVKYNNKLYRAEASHCSFWG